MIFNKVAPFFFFFCIIITNACDVENSPNVATESIPPVNQCIGGGKAPTVTTRLIADNSTFTVDIAGTIAKGGGNVTSQGDYPITERGICWKTSSNPSINDNKASDGTGIGLFSSATMTGLVENTVYHVRAYATNDCGTSYGNDITFNSGFAFGTDHEGGYVFYNDGFGAGLVAAKSDQSASSVWIIGGTSPDTYNNNTSWEIGSGLANSNAIVLQTGHTGSAAKICLDYSNLYSDWYLPSKEELQLMYYKLHVSGFGNFHADSYWSSSEYDRFNAVYVMFDRDFYYIGTKDSPNLRVRAIRNF